MLTRKFSTGRARPLRAHITKNLKLDDPAVAAAPATWSAAHGNVSCEYTPQSLLDNAGCLPLAACQKACEHNAKCKFINSAVPPGNTACELYSGCAKPRCWATNPPKGWWATFQLTSRDASAFPPCASPPPPGPPPTPKATAKWSPTTAGFTGKIKPFWFGANHTGLDSEATLALMAKHSVTGYGWQTGGAGRDGAQSVGRGDAWGSAAVSHAADYMNSHGRGNVTVFQYRQVQVALRLFAQCALAADNPASENFWLHDPETKVKCLAAQPWGTLDPHWNFTSANATKYWVDSVIGELTTDDSLTRNAPMSAVFFDEVDQGFCGYRSNSKPASYCNFSSFDTKALQTSSNAMLTQMVKSLNGAGITPILSLDNRMASTGDTAPCALPEDDTISALKDLTWVRFYENWPGSFHHASGPDEFSAMIANAILEGQAKIANVLHIGGACPAKPRTIARPGPLGGELEFAVASYLVVATAGTTLSVSNGARTAPTPCYYRVCADLSVPVTFEGWYDEDFCWHSEFDVVYGVPLAAAKRTGPHSWTRNYTKCNVAVNVTAGQQGSVELL